VKHRIEFSPVARDDLRALYLYISKHASPERAMAYIDRIEGFCRTFVDFPERGLRRDDLFPGLRVVGFERRISVAFGVTQDAVIFYRFLYGGRDLVSALKAEET